MEFGGQRIIIEESVTGVLGVQEGGGSLLFFLENPVISIFMRHGVMRSHGCGRTEGRHNSIWAYHDYGKEGCG